MEKRWERNTRERRETIILHQIWQVMYVSSTNNQNIFGTLVVYNFPLVPIVLYTKIETSHTTRYLELVISGIQKVNAVNSCLAICLHLFHLSHQWQTFSKILYLDLAKFVKKSSFWSISVPYN
jgi:hypothetical protein